VVSMGEAGSIPKNEHERRPLGLPAIEDKIVQKGIARILEAIQETDCCDCCYGFRPRRSCHQALTAVDAAIMRSPVQYVIEADIKGFFDHVTHDWMMQFLRVRVRDSSLLLLLRRFLKACKEMNTWLKQVRSVLPLSEIWRALAAKLRGPYRYYGVSGNSRRIRKFGYVTIRAAQKWLNRRSQRKSFPWKTVNAYLTHYPLPRPRIGYWMYRPMPLWETGRRAVCGKSARTVP
jgi:hypothetical protein